MQNYILVLATETGSPGLSFGEFAIMTLFAGGLAGSWGWIYYRRDLLNRRTLQINMPNNCSVLVRNNDDAVPNNEVTLRCLVSAVAYLRQEIQLHERRQELHRENQPPETAPNEERAKLLQDAENIELTGSDQAPNFFNTTT